MVVDAGPPAPAGPPKLEYKAEKLPKVTPPASLDYLAYDAKNDRVWVPEGKTGSVAIYDVVAGTFSRVEGFKTAEREVRGTKRAMGPSAVAIGDGVAYIGDRADGEVCAVDLGAPKLGKCSKLAAPSDGVAYVAAAKEVWVTTPKQDAIVVLDASKPATLAPKTTVKLEGAPEGYASDDTRGLFFTNLEDKDKTIVIDVKTHKPKATWSPGCGSDGPRGIAADAARGFVYVACTDHVVVLDASHDGAVLAKLDTGAGVDNIEWFAARRLLYVAAGKDAKLTVAQIDDHGQPAVVATGETNQGARNAVVDAHGNAYVADALDAAILVFRAP
jgi:DNA-binding beta-propeller fold protein YncE